MGTPAAWKGPAMAKAKAPALALAAAPGGPARADGPHPGGVVPLPAALVSSFSWDSSFPLAWGELGVTDAVAVPVTNPNNR